MINIIKKEIDVEESLKKRLEIICDFCNTTPTIINGSEEYNSKQTRENRKIKDYFTHVSNNSKNDLACETIIELGKKILGYERFKIQEKDDKCF